MRISLFFLLLFTYSFAVAAPLSRARVVELSFFDDGTDTTTESLDITQGTCTENNVTTPEPFLDSSLKFKVLNNYPFELKIKSIQIYLRGSNATHSKKLAIGSGYIPAKSVAEISSLFLDVQSATKALSGGRALDSSDYGFRNFRFVLNATSSSKKNIKINVTKTLSIDNIDRCP